MNKRWRMAIPWLTVLAAGMGLAAEDSVDALKVGMEKWMENRRLVSREEQDWRVGRGVLQDRVALLKQEVELLRQKAVAASNEVADVETKLQGARTEIERVKTVADDLRGTATRLEAETRTLLARMPEPLQERLKPLAQRMPDKPDDTRITVPERFQAVIGVINEIAKANGEFHLATEIRKLSDGTSAEVRTLYVGLAQAFFVSGKGEAGVGSPAADGWTWTTTNGLAGGIAEAMDILQNKVHPHFVQLPVRIAE